MTRTPIGNFAETARRDLSHAGCVTREGNWGLAERRHYGRVERGQSLDACRDCGDGTLSLFLSLSS